MTPAKAKALARRQNRALLRLLQRPAPTTLRPNPKTPPAPNQRTAPPLLMNPLEQFIADNHLDPVQAMNDLTDAGLIFDLAILPQDVAKADIPNAVAFLDQAPT